MQIATVSLADRKFRISFELFDLPRTLGIPGKTKVDRTVYEAPVTPESIYYIKHSYKSSEVTGEVQSLLDQTPIADDYDILPFITHKNPPRPYQIEALNKAAARKSFALFMQMRTGKTYVTITLASTRFQAGYIDRVLVICPTGVKTVWDGEFKKHCPIPYKLYIHESGLNRQTNEFCDDNCGVMKVLVVGVEAMSSGSAHNYARKFVTGGKALVVVDESTTIKQPTATRTKRAIEICDLAECRLILNGSPVSQGIEDLYSQFRALDWRIIGSRSFFGFKARYCRMGGYENKSIVGYQHVPELMEKIKPYVYEISTKDAVGIPEEVYTTRQVECSPEQKRILKELGDPLMIATSGDDVLDVQTVLERMTRYQQVVGGFFPYDTNDGHKIKPIGGSNPKLDALLKFLCTEPLPEEKVIIWARFKDEANLIIDQLSSYFGEDSVVTYRGGMQTEERAESLHRFRDDVSARYMVANQQSGARGIDLSTATIHVFYSNTFSLDDRLQAEMRTHGSNQKSTSVLYVDLVANHKIDKMIIEALQSKKSLADFVLKSLKER